MNVPIEAVVYLIGAAITFGALIELMSTIVGERGYRLSSGHVQSILITALLFWWLIAIVHQVNKFNAWRIRRHEEA